MDASSKPFFFDTQRTVRFNRQVGAIENSKGEQYPLSTQPYLALCLLCTHPRQVVTWKQIWEAAHPNIEAYESDSFARARAIIGELRSTLSAAGVDNSRKLIETKRGRGVILNSPLKLSGSAYTYAYLTLDQPMKYFAERITSEKASDILLEKQIEWLRAALAEKSSVDTIPSSLDVARLYVKLKMAYGSNPNATALFSMLRDSSLGDVPAVSALQATESEGLSYSSTGYIFELLALALINTGFQSYMLDARWLLKRALETYFDLFDFSIESLRHVISSQWLLSVTHKVEDNSGLTRDICHQLLEYLKMHESDIPLQFSESAILPVREIASLEVDNALLSELASFMASDAEADSRERFFTVRSALESAIASGDVERSQGLFHAVFNAYSKCWRSIEGNHVIALAKDVLDFYIMTGENVRAMRYGTQVLQDARELGLLKQADAVEAALKSIVR